ncbi:MAG: bifunctional 2-polyprenyl-6-hydroxyphenol methylase/3-demethylubiquinol 3-O-methyltransferase UbiG [Pseudomonadota bacterium]
MPPDATTPQGTVDPAEIAKFEAIAAEWWDPSGKFRPLHAMNPCRLDYLLDQTAAQFGLSRKGRRWLEGVKTVDVGCGGGLLCEPLARLGADVTGLDAAAGNIDVAKAHAVQMGLTIDYQAKTSASLVAEGATFDLVLAMEIVEHVADLPTFLGELSALVRPGGLLVMSTLNRTAQSWAVAIVGAERIMRWLPVGTHDWSKFPKPDELEAGLTKAGLSVVDAKGMVLDPIRGDWLLSAEDLSVNYILTAEKA